MLRSLSRKLIAFFSLPLILLAFGTPIFLMQHQARAGQAVNTALSSLLPDTTSNIHIGLPFDYNTTPSAYTGKVDYIWGSGYPQQPPSGVFHTFYVPYDRDEDTRYYQEAHDITWWKANHPDWIEYRCDKTTVAYEFGESDVPLDITNPNEVAYMQHIYIDAALTGTLLDYPGAKFEGIAFDNPNFQNAGSWTGQRCGHYDTAGNWVQQFTGTSDDAAYRQAVITWTKNMQAYMHSSYPNNPMSENFSFDFSYPADSNTLLSSIDIDNDEQGFTNGNSASPSDPNSWYYTDSDWLQKMQALQTFMNSGPHGWFPNNQEPVSFANLSNAQVQWALANYLMAKNNASYLSISGYQEYGSLQLRPEYNAPIGSPTNAYYSSQNVYMRDFTNGRVLVNPSSSTQYTVSLPSGTYQDLYGNTIGSSYTLPVHSGAVLLFAPGVTPTPTSTPILTPTSTSTPMTYPGGIKHAFVIAMENHDWSQVKGAADAPYINSLLTRPDASYASDYHNVLPTETSTGDLHPSEPNYVWMEAGTNAFADHTFTTDNDATSGNYTTSTAHLSTLLQNAGLSWKAYQESKPSGCPITSSGEYAAKHNPYVFFTDVSGNPPSTSSATCMAHVVDYTSLSSDLSNNTVPAYSFITPNLCNDMHDNCSPQNDPVAQGDTWLSNNLPAILNSTAYKDGGAVFLTWDEGSSTNSPIGMIVLSPAAKGNGYTNTTPYSHSSLVRTLETIYGLSPLLANAAGASDLSDLFMTASGVTPTPTPTPDTTPPTVSITSPLNGSSVKHNSTVTITATASDNVGVTKVEFWVTDGTGTNVLKCTDTSAPYSCAWHVGAKFGVKHTLTAKAYDAAGNATVSSPVVVTTK